MVLRLLVVASSFVVMVSCGGGSGSRVAVDAAPADTTAVDAPGERCATHRVVHFDVHPVVAGATIPDGRITAWFYQLNDDLKPRPPRLVTYDRPFTGTSTTVDISLDDVMLPQPLENYQLCERACDALPACGCTSAGPRLALAAVAVYVDRDGSGAIESSEVVDDNEYGVGYVQLGAADRAYAPPTVFDSLAPQGLVDCLAPYSILPPPANESFNDLGIPAEDARFPLDICVPGDASCSQVRRPNLF
jgi:hypothetical protein